MMPLDFEPARGDSEDDMMMCLCVGGVADGAVIKIRIDAETIELGRPTYVKPLESRHQAQPEIAKETSTYHVNIMWIPFEDTVVAFAIGVVDGQDAGWAMRELAVAYQEKSLEKLRSENMNG